MDQINDCIIPFDENDKFFVKIKGSDGLYRPFIVKFQLRPAGNLAGPFPVYTLFEHGDRVGKVIVYPVGIVLSFCQSVKDDFDLVRRIERFVSWLEYSTDYRPKQELWVIFPVSSFS